MALLVAVVIGGFIGIVLRYALPKRHWYGLALLPGVGAAATGIAWEIAEWSGIHKGAGGLWWIGLGAAVIVSVAVALILPRLRERSRRGLLRGGARVATVISDRRRAVAGPHLADRIRAA